MQAPGKWGGHRCQRAPWLVGGRFVQQGAAQIFTEHASNWEAAAYQDRSILSGGSRRGDWNRALKLPRVVLMSDCVRTIGRVMNIGD